MGLIQCANTQIGKAGVKKGISGGESKRLSVACEVSIIYDCYMISISMQTFHTNNINNNNKKGGGGNP